MHLLEAQGFLPLTCPVYLYFKLTTRGNELCAVYTFVLTTDLVTTENFPLYCKTLGWLMET